MGNYLKRFWKEDSGADTIEWILTIAMSMALIVFVMNSVQGAIQRNAEATAALIDSKTNEIQGGTGGAGGNTGVVPSPDSGGGITGP